MKKLELTISSPKGVLHAVMREPEVVSVVAAMTTFTGVVHDLDLAGCTVSLQLDGEELPGETLLAKLEALQALLPSLEALLSPVGMVAGFAQAVARKGRAN